MPHHFATISSRQLLASLTALAICTAPGIAAAQEATLKDPDGMIPMVRGPQDDFEGRIFFINDWDGGDKDNQNAGEEVNANSPIVQGLTILSDWPGKLPRKVKVEGLVTDAQVLADASREGPLAIAMGAHSRHVIAWLTALPAASYNYSNIVLVTHSNWNEMDGRDGYKANSKPGDPPIEDSDGVALRRGLYRNLARIADLGVTIWEIPRVDHGAGGWGGSFSGLNDESSGVKSLDISDLGVVYYLRTGRTEATHLERNAWASPMMQKPARLEDVPNMHILRYFESNRGVPGEREDYLPGGKYYR